MAEIETGFVRPDRALFEELVISSLRAAGERTEPARCEIVEHGSANLVVLAGTTAVRVSRTERAAVELERAQRLIDRLPPLPFAVPQSVADPVRAGGLVAVAQRRLRGEPHPSGSGDPHELQAVLAALRSVSLEGMRSEVAPPRAFMGGDAWRELMRERAIPLLPARVRSRAERMVDAMAELNAPGPPSLTHGDLAGANMLWSDGHVVGVLDWDLASAGDPADDVAALGTWHGWDAVVGFVAPGVEHRARTIAATYPLQLVCFAIVQGRPEPEIQRAVERAGRLLSHATN